MNNQIFLLLEWLFYKHEQSCLMALCSFIWKWFWLVKSHYPLQHLSVPFRQAETYCMQPRMGHWLERSSTYVKHFCVQPGKWCFCICDEFPSSSIFYVWQPMFFFFFCRQPTPALLWIYSTRNWWAHSVWTGNSTRAGWPEPVQKIVLAISTLAV